MASPLYIVAQPHIQCFAEFDMQRASSFIFILQNIITQTITWHSLAGLLKESFTMKHCSCSYISHPGKELILVCLVPIGPICA